MSKIVPRTLSYTLISLFLVLDRRELLDFDALVETDSPLGLSLHADEEAVVRLARIRSGLLLDSFSVFWRLCGEKKLSPD